MKAPTAKLALVPPTSAHSIAELDAIAPSSTPIAGGAVQARLVGYSAAAVYLGVPEGTLRSWVARGDVPHYRLGKRLVKFDPQELSAWLVTKRGGAR